MPAMVTKKKSPAKKKTAAKKTAAPVKKAAATPSSSARRKRQIYLEGHKRKFLVVVDETPECESALAFAASRAQRTKGQLALLYVIEPEDEAMHWLGVEDIAREEGQSKAKAMPGPMALGSCRLIHTMTTPRTTPIQPANMLCLAMALTRASPSARLSTNESTRVSEATQIKVEEALLHLPTILVQR